MFSLNSKKFRPRYLILRLWNAKDKKILLNKREVTQHFQVIFSSIKNVFFIKTIEVKKSVYDIFNALKEKVCQPRLLYLTKLDIEVEIKKLTYKQN